LDGWRDEPDHPRLRFQIVLPEDHSLADVNRTGIAISPDGNRIAYATGSQVYVREMDELEARVEA